MLGIVWNGPYALLSCADLQCCGGGDVCPRSRLASLGIEMMGAVLIVRCLECGVCAWSGRGGNAVCDAHERPERGRVHGHRARVGPDRCVRVTSSDFHRLAPLVAVSNTPRACLGTTFPVGVYGGWQITWGD